MNSINEMSSSDTKVLRTRATDRKKAYKFVMSLKISRIKVERLQTNHTSLCLHCCLPCGFPVGSFEGILVWYVSSSMSQLSLHCCRFPQFVFDNFTYNIETHNLEIETRSIIFVNITTNNYE